MEIIKKAGTFVCFLLGPICILTLYALLALNCYTYFVYISFALHRRIGLYPSMAWFAIGLTILFNVVFNHTLATLIKPGSPTDLRYIEQLRHQYKRREHRKEVEDDRFEGLTADVKRLLRYRSKTMSELDS